MRKPSALARYSARRREAPIPSLHDMLRSRLSPQADLPARSRFVFPVPHGQTTRLFVLPSLMLSKIPPTVLRGVVDKREALVDPVLLSAALVRLEVWGLEPQTYGLQSHRSSH